MIDSRLKTPFLASRYGNTNNSIKITYPSGNDTSLHTTADLKSLYHRVPIPKGRIGSVK